MKPIIAALCLVAAMLAGPVRADETSLQASQFFVNLYGSICVQSGAEADVINKIFVARKAVPLKADKAAPFLHGHPGTVWPVLMPFGVYVVAAFDEGMCSVFAKQANTTEIDRLFATSVESMPVKAPFRRVKTDDGNTTQAGDTAHYQSYQYGIPGKPGSFLFALTTMASPGAVIPAMATFARIPDSVPEK